ncbi:hypothetical protein DTL21_27755 [Bremerella cremea]|uniref:Uncharacterized protein n=1 Tax=Blastopirellula marina TaxID=124 RepID=A0A2S8FCH1_9BACT|nr:hypothetical protein C5Y83_27710 [Blastopirellula marina]RCS43134.1 hypothetical protein DTL21_27755 [Bremerella cremea]
MLKLWNFGELSAASGSYVPLLKLLSDKDLVQQLGCLPSGRFGEACPLYDVYLLFRTPSVSLHLNPGLASKAQRVFFRARIELLVKSRRFIQ